MRTSSKLAAAAATVVLLLGAACTRGGDDDEETTPAPTQPDRVEVADDFQLVGRIAEAFTGAEPDVEVPERESVDVEDDDADGPTLSPQDESVGGTASIGGVMRITIEDASNALSAECGTAAEEDVDVYWTTDTSFDPDDVVEDVDARNEDGIEGRIAGVSGRILLVADEQGEITSEAEPTVEPTDSEDDAELDESEATGSPDFFGSEDLRSDEGADDCVLVADQIGFESPTLPTPSTTTGTRRPAVAATPEPDDDTPEPTEEPQKTKAPDQTDEPEETDPPATSTGDQDDQL